MLTSCAATTFSAVELLEKAAHDRRLAGADLAGDDDEPLALIEPVLEVGERALVPAAAEVERRVGIELERLAGQPEEGFVHRGRYRNVWVRPTKAAASL